MRALGNGLRPSQQQCSSHHSFLPLLQLASYDKFIVDDRKKSARLEQSDMEGLPEHRGLEEEIDTLPYFIL